jgi:hypothetical protein
LKKGSNKEQISKIEDLTASIDVNSLKIYDLYSTEKLIVADLKPLKGFETSDKTKAIFFVYENKITHSNIVTFNAKIPFDNFDKVILSVLDMKKNKDNYTGKISFYNLFQNITLSDEFENGKLTVNGMARRKTTKKITGKSTGCTDWYWITTYSDGHQTEDYLYTTCSCEEEAYRMASDCGGGGGSGASTSTGGVIYPTNPENNRLFTYIDKEGKMITERFDSKSGTWVFAGNSLTAVVVQNNYENYYFLIFQWPVDKQKVVDSGIVYTYDGGSGGWTGEPATEELIAQAIEDNIDDTQLDPCTKGVLDKLKNLEQGDIAKMLNRFSPADSIFNIKMSTGQVIDPNNFAETKKVTGSTTDINMVFNEDYIKGTNNINPPTDLSVATTMAHEVIHAYLISLLEENKTSGAS